MSYIQNCCKTLQFHDFIIYILFQFLILLSCHTFLWFSVRSRILLQMQCDGNYRIVFDEIRRITDRHSSEYQFERCYWTMLDQSIITPMRLKGGKTRWVISLFIIDRGCGTSSRERLSLRDQKRPRERLTQTCVSWWLSQWFSESCRLPKVIAPSA